MKLMIRGNCTVLGRVSSAVIKHHEQRQLGEKKVNFIKHFYGSPSLREVGARICAGPEPRDPN